MAYPFVHPNKLLDLKTALRAETSTGKKGPKGRGTKGRKATPHELAWRSYEMRRSALLKRYGLPGPTET
jgi:hypothetical protein